MMKKALALLMISIWTVALLAGCGTDPLVGTWTATINGDAGQMTLNENNTGEIVSNGKARPCTWAIENGELTVKQTIDDNTYIFLDRVTYVIQDDTLTITSKSGKTLTFTKAE